MNLPNKISLFRILIIPVLLLFILPLPEGYPFSEAYSEFVNEVGIYVGVIIFIIASLTDSLDGYIARKTNSVTKMGQFLDPIADKLLITASLIALVQQQQVSGWAAFFIISREFIITGLREIAAGEGIIISASKWGKAKTATQIIAIIFVMLDNYPFAFMTELPIDTYILVIAVILTVYSGVDYMKKNFHVLTGHVN